MSKQKMNGTSLWKIYDRVLILPQAWHSYVEPLCTSATIFIWFISDLQFRDFDQRRATAFVTDIVKAHEDNQQGP